MLGVPCVLQCRRALHELFWVRENGAFLEVLLLGTIVAEIITELIRFEPEVCICNGN